MIEQPASVGEVPSQQLLPLLENEERHHERRSWRLGWLCVAIAVLGVGVIVGLLIFSNTLIEDASDEETMGMLILLTIVFLAIATVYAIAQIMGSYQYHSRLLTYYRSRVLLARVFSIEELSRMVTSMAPDHIRFGKGPEAPFAALASLPRIRRDRDEQE